MLISLLKKWLSMTIAIVSLVSIFFTLYLLPGSGHAGNGRITCYDIMQVTLRLLLFLKQAYGLLIYSEPVDSCECASPMAIE
jgi:hypothetical protein